MNIVQLHRATPVQCPPCNGQCDQGRNCNAEAGSACSELLEDDKAESRMALAAQFWTAYLAILLAAVCAVFAYFLPVLSALLNN